MKESNKDLNEGRQSRGHSAICSFYEHPVEGITPFERPT